MRTCPSRCPVDSFAASSRGHVLKGDGSDVVAPPSRRAPRYLAFVISAHAASRHHWSAGGEWAMGAGAVRGCGTRHRCKPGTDVDNARTRGEDVSAAWEGVRVAEMNGKVQRMRWRSNRRPSARADGGWWQIWPLLECERFQGEVLRITTLSLASGKGKEPSSPTNPPPTPASDSITHVQEGPPRSRNLLHRLLHAKHGFRVACRLRAPFAAAAPSPHVCQPPASSRSPHFRRSQQRRSFRQRTDTRTCIGRAHI